MPLFFCFYFSITKSNEKLKQAQGKHGAYTSVQNCGIFPSNEELSAANEHILIMSSQLL